MSDDILFRKIVENGKLRNDFYLPRAAYVYKWYKDTFMQDGNINLNLFWRTYEIMQPVMAVNTHDCVKKEVKKWF